MKKITFLFLIIFALSASFAFADSDGIVIKDYKFVPNKSVSSIKNPNVGVAEMPRTRAVSKPRSTKDLSDDNYYFSGNAQVSDLYTNHKFTGKKSYTVEVNNDNDEDLKLYIYKDGKFSSIKKVTVPSDGETSFKVTGLSKSDKIYIRFCAPCDFRGEIK